MDFTPEQWEQLKATFEAALELTATERFSFVAGCSLEPRIRQEVERLLASHSEAGQFLSEPILPSPGAAPVAKEHTYSPDTVLAGRFKIRRFIARGGMGEVYEAEDLELHEQVALKTVRPELLLDPSALRRFKREVHLAKKVTHPNVCRIFDLFRGSSSGNQAANGGQVVVSMELLQGENLAERLARVRCLSMEETLPIAVQITSGLGAAHELGILHRDLKPANIMLLQDAKCVRAVITDFGLAFQATGTDTGPLLTSSDNFGTPAYMSPEQVEGRPLTLASDIYSLGLVLYQMITGVRAFDGPTPLSVAVRRLTEDPPRPRSVVSDLNPIFEAVILKALERRPERRYQSATEMGADLSKLSMGDLSSRPDVRRISLSPALTAREHSRVLMPERSGSKLLEPKRIPEFRVWLKTWELSRDHLGSILAVDEYDESGKRVRTSAGRGRKYSFEEELFVPPPEKEMLLTFVEKGPAILPTPPAGLVLLGPAGAGKSNLLASVFLEQRRAGDLAIFLTGRFMDTSNIEEYVNAQVARFISGDWALESCCDYASACGCGLTLYIDAANEFCGPGGTFRLLDSLRALINRSDLPALRVVLSCRAETWRLYEDEKAIKLFDSGRLFQDEPLMLRSFDDHAQTRLLFETYSKFYRLRPSSYAELSPVVKDLIRSPFMMSIIAETYSNQTGEQALAKVIPADLDYYNVFRRLTQRKKQDARRLLSRNDPRREYFDEAIDNALLSFSQLLLTSLRSTSDASSHTFYPHRVAAGDALSSATLTHEQQFFEHWNVPPGRDDAISTFQAIVQVGLIDAVSLTDYGPLELLERRTAYKFFHDQYTQYWLSRLYQTQTLGRLVSHNEQRLHDIAENVCKLLHEGIQVPVLSGAIDHWLYMNMVISSQPPVETPARVDIGLLTCLLNQLALNPSPVVKEYVSSFLATLTTRGVVPPDQLFETVFREGNEKLRVSLAGYFMECWPGALPELLSTFLAHCEVEDDAEVLKRLGSVFAYHFERAPLAIVDYLDQSLKPIDTVARALAFALEQSPVRLGWQQEYAPQIAFLITFATLSALANFHSEIHMSQMRAFVRKKYPWLLETILNKSNPLNVQEEGFRFGLYRRLEREGITQWDQVIGAQGNDTFFVEDEGLVQRDELNQYFKYLVATHNGDLKELDLSPGSEFRRATMAMLTYRAASAIGYIATISLAMRLVRESDRLEEIVAELATVGGAAGLHFGSLLLVDISYMDPALSRRALELLAHTILPKAISGGYPFHRAILDCLGIAAIDLAANWEICEPAIRHILEQATRRATPTALASWGSELAKVSYFDDIDAGRKMIVLLLTDNYLNDPVWRPCVMKILAGMQLRNPGLLRSIMDQHGEEERTQKEVRLYASDDLKDHCDKFFYMVSWNRLIAEAIVDDAKLRYFLIKILMGGLAQSNSVIEYTREFRRFVIAIIRAYWGEPQDPNRYLTLTMEEAFAETLAKRRIGGGKLWIPKSPRNPQKLAQTM